MVLSNLLPSEGVFCGEELLDSDWGSGGCPAPSGDSCEGLKGLEEAEDLESFR